ncbi:MAG: response regulator [Gammaproteobacteria bacterium]|nr:response regulator [Gammaproteobacteria bacterium]
MTEKTTVLLVDDEQRILRSLKMLFRSEYKVLTAPSGSEALDIIKHNTVHVIVSDQRMPVMAGAELLRQVKEASPNTMRLLLTGYSDLKAVTDSVNEGEIFRYINKPWDNENIKATVAKAAEIALSQVNVPPEPPPETQQVPSAKKISEKIGFLVIDEDKLSYETVKRVVGEKYSVKWGASLDEAFEILANENIVIVISEVKIKGEDITNPLKNLKRLYPEIITLVLTSFQDTKALIELINQGQIYRFLPKPILTKLLAQSIQASLRHYVYVKKSPQLLKRCHVEPAKKEETAKISGKIMGFLKKIRERL